MTRTFLALVIVVSLAGCSDDDSTSDLGTPHDQSVEVTHDQSVEVTVGDLWTRCPAGRPADNTPCSLPSTDPPCDYVLQSCPCGPSDIAWHCSCDSGLWKCSRDYDCYPCPDGSVDSASDFFACGAQKQCKLGEEYCMKITPGACGGDPVPDSGVCPPDCQPTTCGGTEQYCLCPSISCTALPSGCGSCSCLGVSGCTCTEAGGSIQVSCAAP